MRSSHRSTTVVRGASPHAKSIPVSHQTGADFDTEAPVSMATSANSPSIVVLFDLESTLGPIVPVAPSANSMPLCPLPDTTTLPATPLTTTCVPAPTS